MPQTAEWIRTDTSKSIGHVEIERGIVNYGSPIRYND